MNREYNNNLIEMNGPHVLSSERINTKMFLVALALMPQLVVSMGVFGRRTLYLTVFCALLCIALEVAMNLILKKRPLADDFTCLVTGILIAFNLSSETPYWVAAAGCFVAIILVKGIGAKRRRNRFNPAAVGICVVYLVLGNFVGPWPAPLIGSPDIPAGAVDVKTGLEILNGAEGIMPTNWEQFLGMCPGAFGQVGAIALLIGGVFLLWKKLINWRIPLSILVTMAIYAIAAGMDPIASILSGGAVIGAVFMATDPVTSPIKTRGCIVYGIFIGLIAMTLRIYTPIDDGIFAGMIIMNFFSQYIDRFFILRDFRKANKAALKAESAPAEEAEAEETEA